MAKAREAIGGAVLLVPKRPTSEFEGYVEGSIGDYNLRRVQAVVNIPVMDSLRIRLVAQELGLTAFVSPTRTGPVGGATERWRELKEAAGVSLGRIIGFRRLVELTG